LGVLELNSERIVTVFGSSRPRETDPEYKRAYEIGKELALSGFTVCNGGYGGIMEGSARGAKEAGGRTIGIIADIFPRQPNPWIDKAVTTKSLVDRMMMLIAQGEAFVVLKGGTGTLLELAAVWEFMNKGIVKERPIVVVGDFWNGVINTLKAELSWEGLEDCTKYVTLVDSPAACASFISHQLTGTSDGNQEL
jgi:uncharacterized protein (TIGR00725 family)